MAGEYLAWHWLTARYEEANETVLLTVAQGDAVLQIMRLDLDVGICDI